jgi:hypothetical protein
MKNKQPTKGKKMIEDFFKTGEESFEEAEKKHSDNFIIKTDGTIVEAFPKNGKKFSLEELQAAVGGLIELAVLRDGRDLWFNEEGKLIGLEVNIYATMLWQDTFGSSDVIVGNAIVTKKGQQK